MKLCSRKIDIEKRVWGWDRGRGGGRLTFSGKKALSDHCWLEEEEEEKEGV